MKTTYVIVFTIGWACPVFCIAGAMSDTGKDNGIVGMLPGWASSAVPASILNLLVVDKRVCTVAYSVFFACVDWLLYYILLFCYEFSGVDLERYVKRRQVRASDPL